jgi:hypothetical protein
MGDFDDSTSKTPEASRLASPAGPAPALRSLVRRGKGCH